MSLDKIKDNLNQLKRSLGEYNNESYSVLLNIKNIQQFFDKIVEPDESVVNNYKKGNLEYQSHFLKNNDKFGDFTVIIQLRNHLTGPNKKQTLKRAREEIRQLTNLIKRGTRQKINWIDKDFSDDLRKIDLEIDGKKEKIIDDDYKDYISIDETVTGLDGNNGNVGDVYWTATSN